MLREGTHATSCSESPVVCVLPVGSLFLTCFPLAAGPVAMTGSAAAPLLTRLLLLTEVAVCRHQALRWLLLSPELGAQNLPQL